MNSSRRDFLRKAAVGVTVVAIGSSAKGMSAQSYSRIIGANDCLQIKWYWYGWKWGTADSGTALEGGGSMSDAHILDFFDAIRGKTNKLNSPIEMGAKSQMLTHYANIAFRIGKSFQVDSENGRIYDRDAMKLWGREYEKGWEPKM